MFAVMERVNARRVVPVAYRPAPDPLRPSEFGRRPAVVFTAFTINRERNQAAEDAPLVLRRGRAPLSLAAYIPRGRMSAFTPQQPTLREIPAGYGASVPTL